MSNTHARFRPRRIATAVCAFVCMTLVVAALPSAASAERIATGSVAVHDPETDERLAPAEDVLVSDGHRFVRTDAQGRYELELDENARWVMVVNPPDFKPTESFYQLIGDGTEELELDFRLHRDIRNTDEPFSFIHLSDTHVGNEYRGRRIRETIVRAVNRLPQPPAFVMETGDLSIDTVERLEAARAAASSYDAAYLPAMGNHDRPRAGDYRAYTYERLFTPTYHAFAYRNYLFVALPWRDDMSEAYAWTRELLEQLTDEHVHIIAYMHHWDGLGGHYDDFLELFRAHDVRAVFMGHYHINQMTQVEGIPVYLITSAVPYNRDLAVPAFNIVTAHPDGELAVEQRLARYDREVNAVAPAPQQPLRRGRTEPVAVTTYDPSVRVESVSVSFYEMGLSGALLAEVRLESPNNWAWRGEVTVGDDWPAKVRMVVSVADERADRWASVEHWVSLRETDESREVRLGTDWATFRGDVGRSGAAADAVAPPLRLAWTYAASDSFGFNSPIVVDGRVYTAIENNREPVEPRPAMVALDAVTGAERWTHELAGRSIRATPASDGDRLVAQADDGMILALDAETGEQRWQRSEMLSRGRAALIYLNASPLLDGGDVITGVGRFYARLARDGETVHWLRMEGRGGRGFKPPAPLIAGEQVILTEGSTLRAVTRDTGETRWETSFAASINATPALADDRLIAVIAPEDRWSAAVAAIDIDDGAVLWQQPLTHRGFAFNPPVTSGQHGYVIDEDALVALDLTDGAVIWREDLEGLFTPTDYFLAEKLDSASLYPDTTWGMVVGSALSGNHLYLVTRTGRLAAFDLDARELVWRFDLGTYVDSTPAISGNALYITGRNGMLYAFVESP